MVSPVLAQGRLADSNKNLVTKALLLLGELGKAMGPPIERVARPCLVPALQCLAVKQTSVRRPCHRPSRAHLRPTRGTACKASSAWSVGCLARLPSTRQLQKQQPGADLSQIEVLTCRCVPPNRRSRQSSQCWTIGRGSAGGRPWTRLRPPSWRCAGFNGSQLRCHTEDHNVLAIFTLCVAAQQSARIRLLQLSL